MFKYIKKLTSVVVMFAIIIVFSTSKVFASTTISDGEKIYSVLTKLPEYPPFIELKKNIEYNKKKKNLFIISLSLIVAHDLFPKKNDNKKINIAIDASSGEHAKNLPILRPPIENLFNKPDANINISIRNNINHLPISNLLTNPYLFPPTKSLGSFCTIQIKAETGKFYDATKEKDESYTLTVAGLAKFKKDKEEAEKLQAERNNDGNSGGGC